MGMEYCFVVKIEFKNNWHDILTEKIADLAVVERVEQSPCVVSYGSKTLKIEGLSENFSHGIMVCVKHQDGFFLIFGWHVEGEKFVLLRVLNNQTTNKKTHKEVAERLIDVFSEMSYEALSPPKPTWLNIIRHNPTYFLVALGGLFCICVVFLVWIIIFFEWIW